MQGCDHQFSVTSGTIFANRKLPVRDYLLAIAIFVNEVKGKSALALSRDLGVQYKTAFVLAHKIREALAAEVETVQPAGEVEIDGCYVGGYVKPSNFKENRRDRRLAINQNGKRRVVVAMRERNGRTLPFVFKSEAESVAKIAERVDANAIVHADEAAHWDRLHAIFLTKRVNHEWAYSHDEACTNQAESFFSRIRRAEIGTTTISAARISPPIPARWRGARIIAASRTASNVLRSRASRWRIQFRANGRVIGSGGAKHQLQ